MKLSEAIVLGDMLKKNCASQWLSPDGSCGCAFGGALLAAGVNASEFFGQHMGSFETVAEAPAVKGLWPWITPHHLDEITELHLDVRYGKKTIEDVAAYVRTIEPAEEATPQTEPESLLVAASVAQ